ncbi:hypothetical protein CSUI_002028 [Cystoisospora suis]|uniref:Uncharacterized protein n=1 Tax=Cystoisospora suis TaxID=483139 RepID=A0A2C6L6B9_9APIC|nr:hypothetical protein CSUI_002028 [Cystoisospora suis]
MVSRPPQVCQAPKLPKKRPSGTEKKTRNFPELYGASAFVAGYEEKRVSRENTFFVQINDRSTFGRKSQTGRLFLAQASSTEAGPPIYIDC